MFRATILLGAGLLVTGCEMDRQVDLEERAEEIHERQLELREAREELAEAEARAQEEREALRARLAELADQIRQLEQRARDPEVAPEHRMELDRLREDHQLAQERLRQTAELPPGEAARFEADVHARIETLEDRVQRLQREL